MHFFITAADNIAQLLRWGLDAQLKCASFSYYVRGGNRVNMLRTLLAKITVSWILKSNSESTGAYASLKLHCLALFSTR